MAVHVRTVVRLLAPLLVAATLLVPASAPAEPLADPGVDLAECQVLPEVAYGEPGAPYDGSSCRVAAPTRDGRHLLVTDRPWETTDVETGEQPCRRTSEPCVLQGGRTYEVHGDGPASVVAVGAAGCQTMGADIADTWSSVRPAGGAACVDTPHKSWQDLRVLSAGGNAGRVDELTTPGRRTLRLVRTAGAVDDAVLLAVARYDSPQGCEELTAGAYGTREGADVTIAPGQVAACLTFPRDELLLTNSFAWERTGGAGEVDVRVGNEVDRACRPPWSEEPQDAVHLDCETSSSNLGHNESVTVLITSNAVASSWRFVRRVPGVSPGCAGAASTEPGGAATTGSVEAYVAFDCVTVEGEWTDRFVFDVTDGGTGLDLDTYGASGYACDEPFHRLDTCQGVLSPLHYVTVRPATAIGEPASYALDTWKVETLDGWVPECRRVASWEEPAVLSGTLADDRTGECLVLDDGGGAQYRFSDLPPGVEVDLVPGGRPQDALRFDDGTWAQVGGDQDAGIVLLSRAQDGTRDARSYEVGVECLQPGWCASLPWTPTAPPVIEGTPRVGNRLRATTGEWSPSQPDGFRYLWLVDGVPVPSGGLLTPEMVGREVRVRVQATEGSIADGDSVVSAPVTVRLGPAPVLVDPPRLRGSTRVGRLAGVARGTWDPEVRRTEYRWRVDGRLLRETGHRIWLERRMVGSRVTVHEIARLPGLRPGRVFVGAFTVRRR